MCEARCKRAECSVSARLASSRASATWPEVLHRHCATEKRITGVTQSLALHKDSSVSARPNPSGLTTPAAVTATRAGEFALRCLSASAIFEHQKLTLDFYCFLKGSILQVTAKRETDARKLVDCQLSLFNGDLKSDKRKQLPGCVFLE
jgi:hypothetical protein